MKTSKKGIDFIKSFEGIHDGDKNKHLSQPAMCPAGVWTVGYGYALVNIENGMYLRGQEDYELVLKQYPDLVNLTEQQACDLLAQTLKKYEDKVNKKLTVSVDQNQFDALVSHTYNTGGSDTLFKLVNAKDLKGAVKWIETKYTTANGKILKGLVRRRKEESKLFMS